MMNAEMSVETLKMELADARVYLNHVLDQVGDRWDTQIYSDGAAWNARQLLIHLAISDMGQTNSVMAIAAGQDNIPADFDLDRYNKRSVEKRADMTPAEARQMMVEARAKLNDWLDTVDEATLSKRGRHGSLNIYTVAEFLHVMADHER